MWELLPRLPLYVAFCRLRASIAARGCACPMANASYANMLLHPPTLLRVAGEVL